MKIAVATAFHETNTFTDGRTGFDDFETAADGALLTSFDAGRSLDGIVENLRGEGIEVIPTYGAATIPAGTVTRDAFETIQREIVSRVEDERLDGICLDLHGSMFVDGLSDPEGELLSTIRESVGEDMPITAALDMHATITERMVTHLDGVAGYRTAPHTDVTETGERAADLLISLLTTDAELTLGWEHIPMLLAGEQSETDAEPMRTLMAKLRESDRRTGIYDANYFLGFPWADSPHAGCHALVTGDVTARETVTETASELATSFWSRRGEFDFTTDAYDVASAITMAAAYDGRPTVVAETGDIPGAGASEDGVEMLAAILDRGGEEPVDGLGTPVVAVVVDRDSLRTCEKSGEDEPVTLTLGRFADSERALDVRGTIGVLHESGDVHVARVDLAGATVVVADRRTNLHRDPDFFHEIGIDPADSDVVVLKSGYLSPAWKEVAAHRLFALTPGDTNQRLADLSYQRIPRPMYPIDDDVEWHPTGR